MADKYTIQVQPQISPSDGNQMERELNRRFQNISKKFGTHLKNSVSTAMKSGALALGAGITGLIATNPFEKVKSDLDKTLAISDDIVTRAAQFGVSTAKFAQLQAVANSVGLEIDLALQQFLGGLQDAKDFQKGDKAKNNALVNFVNDKDVVENFYDFLKSVGSLPAQERAGEVGKVFGDKMQLKLAELLQQPIEQRKAAVMAQGVTPESLGQAHERLAALEDIAALNKVQRDQLETLRKSQAITKGTISADDAVERAKLNREVQNLSQMQVFARQAALSEELLRSVDNLRAHVMDIAFPILQKGVEILERIFSWTEKLLSAIKKIKFWG